MVLCLYGCVSCANKVYIDAAKYCPPRSLRKSRLQSWQPPPLFCIKYILASLEFKNDETSLNIEPSALRPSRIKMASPQPVDIACEPIFYVDDLLPLSYRMCYFLCDTDQLPTTLQSIQSGWIASSQTAATVVRAALPHPPYSLPPLI